MKTYKVYLNIYDYMRGNGCLESIGVGAFHTGVEIKYVSHHSATSNIAIVSAPMIHKTRACSTWNPKAPITILTGRCTWEK